MKHLLAPATIVALALSTTLALATETTTGKVAKFNPNDHVLILEGGMSFETTPLVDAQEADLTYGQQITVTWDNVNGANRALEVMIDR